jgi:hypothetical protein
MKSSSARRRRRRRLLVWTFRLVALAALAAGSFYGARAAFDRFFFSNPDYTLQRIDLEMDGVMTREEALAATGLREGINIFAVNLQEIEAALRGLPAVREVRIDRLLPDRIAVTVRARQPVAWVSPSQDIADPSACPSAFLVDAEAVLIRPHRVLPEHLALPAIFGVDPEQLREGEVAGDDNLKSALALLAGLEARPDSLLRIRRMDVSRGYRIEVLNDENARILFSTEDPGGQLDRLQTLLLHCAETGRAIESVNLMVRRNTPVTFVMASATEHGTAPAAPHGRKPQTRSN